jgi:DNA-binding helix-hairpin-helix protein with protein kinase domain
MNQLLKLNQIIQLNNNLTCTVKECLGGGGQGEVYKADLNGTDVALKWYFHTQATTEQQQALAGLIQKKAPNDKFLWPISLAHSPDVKGFGYIMPLRQPHYKSIADLITRRAEPSFRHLLTATIELVDSFLQLHAKGLCYQDISFGNVFIDTDSGHILICDNDNVTTNKNTKAASVMGTPRFMAPEIVLGLAAPSSESDLFSLAVLLFYMLMLHHPLEGKKEAEIKCFDLPAMNKLYGREPVFIFDPSNDSNRPVAGYQDNAEVFWAIYPQFIKDLFTKAFTTGLHDPQHGRVRESEWRSTLVKLRDGLLYCPHCGAENFYDAPLLKAQGQLNPCWACQNTVSIPPRILLQHGNLASIVMLNHDTQLFPHHIDPHRYYDFSQAVAKVTQHPQNPSVWGLKNLSTQAWDLINSDGETKTIAPGQSVTLSTGINLSFGQVNGQIRV